MTHKPPSSGTVSRRSPVPLPKARRVPNAPRQDSYTKKRRAERFEVKDQRKEIDDFFGAAPLEHPQNLVLDGPATPSAVEKLAASHSEDLVSAPAAENAIASGLNGGMPAREAGTIATTSASRTRDWTLRRCRKNPVDIQRTRPCVRRLRDGLAEHSGLADPGPRPGSAGPFKVEVTRSER